MLSSIAASCTSQLVATTNGLHDDSPVRCLTSDAHFDGRDGQSLTPELTWPAAAEASPSGWARSVRTGYWVLWPSVGAAVMLPI